MVDHREKLHIKSVMAKTTAHKPVKKGTKKTKAVNGLALHESIASIGRTVTPQAWEKFPKDLSENFEHYMYGSPKQSDPRY
jgi:hypothetical protein